MVGVRKKKYASGEGAQFITRKQALKYLQLSLKYFRKLCILKGIYPREPNNRKRAQQGKSTVQTLYSKKDIQFLSHEPLIWKLRDLKVFSKKMARAHALHDIAMLKRQVSLHPTLTLDHIIKERYPTFVDAVRDLDDCLSLCFLFGTFPSLHHVPREQSTQCRRLSIEFMHACIASRALRKIFVSIKGYYYQVQVMGETVTWLAPHLFSFQPMTTEEVDFRIMSTFAEFYVVMLGFINFQLYQSLGLVYPPRLPSLQPPTAEETELVDERQYAAERVAALNIPIAASAHAINHDVPDIDHFPTEAENDDEMERQKDEIAAAQRQKTLFGGLKVFLSREVPREPLVFALRCLGGSVSWDQQLAVGATFPETDETITHHIVDRPSLPNQYLSRYYVQPQWVFDCVNARVLLPVADYLLGATLPPHLSPFVAGADRARVYQPPEATPDLPRYIPPLQQHHDKPEEESEEEEEQQPEADQSKTAGMKVLRGSVQPEDKRAVGRAVRQERQLKERLVARKHRKLYTSMVNTRKKDAKEVWLLRKKRRDIDQLKLQQQQQKV